MRKATKKRLRIAAAACVVISVFLAILALPSRPSPEVVAQTQAELEEWRARHHEDIIHGRESTAGPRPPGPPNPQISPMLVVFSFLVAMAGVAMFFMTLV